MPGAPMIATGYRGIARRSLPDRGGPYGRPSASQNKVDCRRAPGMSPTPARASDCQTKGSAMSVPATVANEKPSRRVTLSRRASFWAVAAFAFLAFAAGAAASPLYRVYEDKFSFAPTTLTLLFTVYIVVLLGTLLLFGSVSDYTGRRIVMLAGLAFGAAGCGLFLIAHGVGLLFAARALQGVAVGLISGAASAALFDLRPNGGAAPVVSSAGPTGRQALGAISASALAQYAPAPTHLVWWLFLGAFVTGVVAVLAMPEPGTARPGVVSSVRPHVSVPQAARCAFATAVPALVGIWALAGFYLSLGPSLVAQLLHSKNLLWGGVLIFLLTGVGAAASALLARKNPSAVMLGGCLVLIVGALVTRSGSVTTDHPRANTHSRWPARSPSRRQPSSQRSKRCRFRHTPLWGQERPITRPSASSRMPLKESQAWAASSRTLPTVSLPRS